MITFTAFLRGINISGKNKVPMAELKMIFEGLGFSEVKTMLNSGNVVFNSESEDLKEITQKIKTALAEKYDFDIPVVVLKKSELEEIVAQAPQWWGTEDKAFYHNLIFIMEGTNSEQIMTALGEPKAEIEQILPVGNAIFWTYRLKDYQKSPWWKKTATSEIKDLITIRTSGTVTKLIKLT